MLRRLWQRFWEWFTEPLPFPRDHWYRQEVVILWDEFDCEDDPATPESLSAWNDAERS